MNIICYIEYSKDKSEKFIHWCFKEKSYSNLSPKIKENREYQIFYSLTKALKIGKEYSDNYNDEEETYSSNINSISDFKDQLQALDIK